MGFGADLPDVQIRDPGIASRLDQLADFIGLDVCLSILRVLHDGLGQDKYAPCPLLVNMVTAGKLGAKSGEGFYIHTRGSKDLVVAPTFAK